MAKVTLRKKALTGERSSPYLDYYPPLLHLDTGKLARREYLGLYVFDKPRKELDRKHKRETQKLAEYIRATRQLEIQNYKYNFLSDEKRNASFADYFRSMAEKRKRSNFDNWYMGLQYSSVLPGKTSAFRI